MALSTVAHAIATKSGNIDRIHRTVSYPVTAFEFLITLNKETRESLIEELTTLSHREEFDFSIENEKIRRGAKRLVLLDVDSTLIQQEVIDLLAKRTPHQAEVSRITDQAMRGELDFDQALGHEFRYLKVYRSQSLQTFALRFHSPLALKHWCELCII